MNVDKDDFVIPPEAMGYIFFPCSPTSDDEKLRISEDREREEYVRAMLRQLGESSAADREFIRAAINSAWINGRKQILRRPGRA